MSAGSFALMALRRQIARIDGAELSHGHSGNVPLGVRHIDAVLGGGLALGALHEVAPATSLHLGAAAGFAAALAARADAGKSVLWVQPDFAGHEGGCLYGPGLAPLGLPLDRVLVLRVARSLDALWAMEEALKSHALSTVVAELPDDTADLTMTRRLVLAARESGTLGLLFRHRSTREPNASMTRWEIAAARGPADAFGGLGPMAFDLSLVKNRRGVCGRWVVSWNEHEHVFKTLPGDLAAVAADRSPRALRARPG